MSKELKQIRGQIRQIVKEMLPEIMKEEIAKYIDSYVQEKITVVEKNVKDTMSEVNTRSKDMQSYIMRVTNPVKK